MIVTTLLALAAGATATGNESAKSDDANKVRCVRQDVSGSLVQKRKVCHTLREWERLRSSAREQGEQMNNNQGFSENRGG